jgi:hypothetical protein
MPRPIKALLWTTAFLGAAGIGAFVAAHSNPFPPNVDGSGGVGPSVGLTSGPAPASPSQVWKGTITSTTSHRLYVGGSCQSDWRGTILLTVHDDASIRGVGTVRRVGPLRCDFSTDQAQIARFSLIAVGTATSRGFELHLTEAASTPSSGADDYGGFLRTVLRPGARSVLEVPATAALAAAGTIPMQVVDAEGRGRYVSRTRVRLGCQRRCGA